MYLFYIKKKIPKIYAFFGPLNQNLPLMHILEIYFIIIKMPVILHHLIC